jgi:hypothetical protein
VSNFSGFGTSYGFDLVPAAAGAITADLAQDVATDAAGNANTAATQFSRTYSPVVNTDPTISDVADLSIDEDGSTGALVVTVGDAETAAGDLTMSGLEQHHAVPDANQQVPAAPREPDRDRHTRPRPDRPATITITVSDWPLSASDTFELTVIL